MVCAFFLLKASLGLQKEIAKVVGVTEVTLRSRYKEFLQNIKLITYN